MTAPPIYPSESQYRTTESTNGSACRIIHERCVYIVRDILDPDGPVCRAAAGLRTRACQYRRVEGCTVRFPASSVRVLADLVSREMHMTNIDLTPKATMVLNVLSAGTPSLMSVTFPVALPHCGLTERTIPSLVARLLAVDERERAGATESRREVRRMHNMVGLSAEAQRGGCEWAFENTQLQCVAFIETCGRRCAVRSRLEDCYVTPGSPHMTLIATESSPRLPRVPQSNKFWRRRPSRSASLDQL